ncbi:hypothetical protein P7K49_026443 [Saguinus oedipus]|uniref:Thyroglobulin type-1 domain-containing protein n=1 Tax=Saguinus oedipus TaxID=9490 RepID=A0ABQ9UD85_SAGOE|nr:hypothetical protein P7K49_026443 [Saguinus oedipus]
MNMFKNRATVPSGNTTPLAHSRISLNDDMNMFKNRATVPSGNTKPLAHSRISLNDNDMNTFKNRATVPSGNTKPLAHSRISLNDDMNMFKNRATVPSGSTKPLAHSRISLNDNDMNTHMYFLTFAGDVAQGVAHSKGWSHGCWDGWHADIQLLSPQFITHRRSVGATQLHLGWKERPSCITKIEELVDAIAVQSVKTFGTPVSIPVCDDSSVQVGCLTRERLGVNVTWKSRLEDIPVASLPDLHDIVAKHPGVGLAGVCPLFHDEELLENVARKETAFTKRAMVGKDLLGRFTDLIQSGSFQLHLDSKSFPADTAIRFLQGDHFGTSPRTWFGCLEGFYQVWTNEALQDRLGCELPEPRGQEKEQEWMVPLQGLIRMAPSEGCDSEGWWESLSPVTHVDTAALIQGTEVTKLHPLREDINCSPKHMVFSFQDVARVSNLLKNAKTRDSIATSTLAPSPHVPLTVKCPEGSYSQDEQCILCPVGFYQEEAGSLACVPCPMGRTTISAGAFSQTHCVTDCQRNEAGLQCDQNGQYRASQRDKGSGKAFCVDSEGRRLPWETEAPLEDSQCLRQSFPFSSEELTKRKE